MVLCVCACVCVICEQVEVKRAVPEGKINPRTEAGCRIFVGGLSEEIKEVDLHQALLKAGYEEEDILEVSVMTVSGSLEHRGFGFISLSTPEKAAELVEKKQLKVKVGACLYLLQLVKN